jgi:hypothetical protein
MKTTNLSLAAAILTILATVACSTEEDASLGKDKGNLSGAGGPSSKAA